MEKNKKYNIIIIGLIVAIALIINHNIQLRREMGYLSNRITNMERNIYNGLDDLSDDISYSIENLLNEQKNLVTNYNFVYKGVDTKTGIVKAQIYFMLKQSDSNGSVNLNVSTQNNSTGKDYECVSTNGINYTCEVEIPFKDNYIINIYEKSDNQSTKKLNSHAYTNNIKNEFENRIHILGMGTRYVKNQTEYAFSLQNKTFGEQDFKVKSVVVKAFYEDKEVFTKDVTDYNIVNYEARERLMLMIAAGDVDSKAVPEIEYSKISTDDQGNEYGNYIIKILHSETGVPMEFNNHPDYRFKIIITFNNGDVSEL
jgi:hypothetical protein